MPVSSPSPTLCNVENEAKLFIHFVCGVGEGGGGDQSCVAKKKRLNRLFVASHSRGKNRHTGKQDTHWEKTNKRKLPFLKMT